MAAPNFSRRHYQAVADVLLIVAVDVIRGTLTEADETWRAVRDTMCEMFEDDNPRFDRAKFDQAIVPTKAMTSDDDA